MVEGVEYLISIDRTSLQIGLNYYSKLLVELATIREDDFLFLKVAKNRLRDLFHIYTGLDVRH